MYARSAYTITAEKTVAVFAKNLKAARSFPYFVNGLVMDIHLNIN